MDRDLRKVENMYHQIGKERIYNKSFENRQDVIKWDVQNIVDEQILKITFISKNSPKRQGIRLATDRGIEINGEVHPAVLLWEDTAPKELICKCLTNDGFLSIYNVWDKGKGTESQSHTSGMLLVGEDDVLTYHCNDIGFETNFDRLVFSIRKL
jgi:hypothetical protein